MPRNRTKQRNNRRLKNRKTKSFSGLKYIILALFVVAFLAYRIQPRSAGAKQPPPSEAIQLYDTLKSVPQGELSVTFIDVGQGDCALIRSHCGATMLIDAGDRGRGARIMQHLHSAGVSKIDYLVATHPHADHIGSMAHIIRNMEIGDIFMPRVQHNTNTFENLIDAIIDKDLGVRTPAPGERVSLGDAEVVFLSSACPRGTNNLNNNSIVLIVRYGEHSILFTGDAERPVEDALVNARTNISATVLDVGHHGSSTSTTANFLRRVAPEIAVIQVGAGNRYGHPTQQTINRLTQRGTKIYRTDIHGTIQITTNGTEITVKTEK